MSDLVEYLAAAGAQQLARSGISVSVDTSVTPRLTVYDARATGPSLLDLLGIQSQITVYSDGKEIASYGEKPKKNYLLASLYVSVLVLGVVAVGATVARVLRK